MQGVSIGGENPTSVVFLVEGAGPDQRGLMWRALYEAELYRLKGELRARLRPRSSKLAPGRDEPPWSTHHPHRPRPAG